MSVTNPPNPASPLDTLLDTALHPERNGLLIKEKVAEGASYERLIKRELKAALKTLIQDTIIGEDEIRPNQKLNQPIDKVIDSITRDQLRQDQRKRLEKL